MSEVTFSYKKYLVFFNTVNVTDMVLNVSMYYDTQSPVLSANISIMDSNDLLSTMNLTSGDVHVLVEFSVVRDGVESEVSCEYYIHSIKDKVQQNQKTMLYTAVCMSNAYKTFTTTRIARQLKGYAPKIASELISQHTLNVSVETTQSDVEINMSSNNDTLINVLARLTKNSTQNGRASYLLYQKTHNTMCMHTINDLLTKQSGQTFYYRVLGVTPKRGVSTKNRHIVTKYEVQHPITTNNNVTGYTGGTATTYDIMNKRSTTKVVANNNQVDAANEKLTPQSNKHVLVSAAGVLPNAGQLENPSSTISNRMAELMRLEQEKVLVQVQGHTELHKHLGTTANLELPSQTDTKQYTLDTKRSGEYVITAIEDTFNRQYYITNVELTKLKLER